MERRLCRSGSDRMLFGVCGGLADYFDVDSTLVRLVFVLISFAGGSGLLAYIILAIVMPRCQVAPAAGRVAMRRNVAETGEGTTGGLGEETRSEFGRDVAAQHAVEGEVISAPRQVRDRQASAGIILVFVGILFLMANTGILAWLQLGRLWPLILIFIGLAIIYQRGRR